MQGKGTLLDLQYHEWRQMFVERIEQEVSAIEDKILNSDLEFDEYKKQKARRHALLEATTKPKTMIEELDLAQQGEE